MKFEILFPGAKRKTIYSPELAEMVGDTHAALLLSQLVFWQGKQRDKNQGWVRKTQKQWEDELVMTRSQLEKARGILVEAGLIEVTHKGAVPPATGYRLKVKEIVQAWVNFQQGKYLPCVAKKKSARSQRSRQNLEGTRVSSSKSRAESEQHETPMSIETNSPNRAKQGVASEPNESRKNSETNRSTSAKQFAQSQCDSIDRDDDKDDTTDVVGVSSPRNLCQKNRRTAQKHAPQVAKRDEVVVGNRGVGGNIGGVRKDVGNRDESSAPPVTLPTNLTKKKQKVIRPKRVFADDDEDDMIANENPDFGFIPAFSDYDYDCDR